MCLIADLLEIFKKAGECIRLDGLSYSSYLYKLIKESTIRKHACS